ncbi:MAG: hypothetical protein IIW93_06880 [Bacteroidaceae bacterium]|nr:hypothetical protein [Bacteroidaceae bacterium]
MKATIFTLDAMVDLYSTGKVTIKNEDIISPMNPVWEVFVNKVRGRMALDGEGNLCFEPYQVGAKQATVMAKEIVGQTTVTRTPQAAKNLTISAHRDEPEHDADDRAGTGLAADRCNAQWTV